MTAEDIQQQAEASFKGPFPYEDCRSVSIYSSQPESFNPNLDYFLSNVAGFALSPSTIPNRVPEQIADGVLFLDKDFFTKYPEHAAVAKYITPSGTPHLYAELNTAESLRPHLLRMLVEAQSQQSTKGSSE